MKKRHLALAVLILLHTSLAFSQYMPTKEDVSLLSKKNDLRVSVSVNSPGLMPLSSTTTITYGITEDISIQCHGITSRFCDLDSDNYFHGASGALGKHKQLTNKSVIEETVSKFIDIENISEIIIPANLSFFFLS